MTLAIQSSAVDLGAAVYYQEAWQLTMETHLPILRSAGDTVVLTVTPHDGFKYEGDFFGLLQANLQPPEYNFIVMRVNGLYAPSEYRRTQLSLLIPSRTAIEGYRQVYQTIQSKLN